MAADQGSDTQGVTGEEDSFRNKIMEKLDRLMKLVEGRLCLPPDDIEDNNEKKTEDQETMAERSSEEKEETKETEEETKDLRTAAEWNLARTEENKVRKTAAKKNTAEDEANKRGIAQEKEWLQMSLETAVKEGKRIGGWVRNWRADKGFGFLVIAGKDVFVHITALRSSEEGIVGKRVVAKVIQDKARGEKSYRAVEAHTEFDYIEIRTKAAAEDAADEAVKAAEKAKRKAEESRRALEDMMQAELIAKVNRPPGLGPITLMPRIQTKEDKVPEDNDNNDRNYNNNGNNDDRNNNNNSNNNDNNYDNNGNNNDRSNNNDRNNNNSNNNDRSNNNNRNNNNNDDKEPDRMAKELMAKAIVVFEERNVQTLWGNAPASLEELAERNKIAHKLTDGRAMYWMVCQQWSTTYEEEMQNRRMKDRAQILHQEQQELRRKAWGIGGGPSRNQDLKVLINMEKMRGAEIHKWVCNHYKLDLRIEQEKEDKRKEEEEKRRIQVCRRRAACNGLCRCSPELYSSEEKFKKTMTELDNDKEQRQDHDNDDQGQEKNAEEAKGFTITQEQLNKMVKDAIIKEQLRLRGGVISEPPRRKIPEVHNVIAAKPHGKGANVGNMVKVLEGKLKDSRVDTDSKTEVIVNAVMKDPEEKRREEESGARIDWKAMSKELKENPEKIDWKALMSKEPKENSEKIDNATDMKSKEDGGEDSDEGYAAKLRGGKVRKYIEKFVTDHGLKEETRMELYKTKPSTARRIVEQGIGSRIRNVDKYVRSQTKEAEHPKQGEDDHNNEQYEEQDGDDDEDENWWLGKEYPKQEEAEYDSAYYEGWNYNDNYEDGNRWSWPEGDGNRRNDEEWPEGDGNQWDEEEWPEEDGNQEGEEECPEEERHEEEQANEEDYVGEEGPEERHEEEPTIEDDRDAGGDESDDDSEENERDEGRGDEYDEDWGENDDYVDWEETEWWA
jgi:cold shock CspA family protein